MENISEKSRNIQLMFDKISPRYNFLNRLLSCRQDVRWREKTVSFMPDISNLHGCYYDIATGTGDLLFCAYERRKDYSKFVGLDLSAGMLSVAKDLANKNNISADFIQASAEDLPLPDESADCVSIAFGLRNVDNRQKALHEFQRVLKSGGVLLILEFFDTEDTFFSRLFKFYFRKILPFIGQIFSDKEAYKYLPQSVTSMPTATEFTKMLTEAKFSPYVETVQWLWGNVRLFIAKKI